jgi:hypothetical protein
LPRGVAFAGDCQLEFRRLQKHRFPHLETDQWLDLFQLWTHAYEARERAATQARLAELVEERPACSSRAPSCRHPLRPPTRGSWRSAMSLRGFARRAGRSRRWERGARNRICRLCRWANSITASRICLTSSAPAG